VGGIASRRNYALNVKVKSVNPSISERTGEALVRPSLGFWTEGTPEEIRKVNG